jgi:acyl-CoA thioesterase-1
MRFCFLIFCLFLSSVSWASDFKLMVFGDSLAAGYRLPKKEAFYTQLEESLKNKGYRVVVVNASRSGETTAGGVKRQKSAIAQKPDAVLLELGVNDAIRNRPINETRHNLQTLIEAFQKNKIPVLLVGMQATPNRPISYRQQFTKMYQELADQYDLILYPFFMDGIFKAGFGSVMPVSDKVLGDNVHPNAVGVRVMVDNILPTVDRFLRQQGVYPSP